MIDTTEPAADETLADVAARVGRTRMTVWRWWKYGVAVGGKVVKLAARRVGGRLVVTREAWREFDAALNPQAPKMPESLSARRRRMDRERLDVLEWLG